MNLALAGDPIDIYLRCAALCARSFAAQDYDFRLITNNPDRLRQRSRALDISSLEIVGYSFRWEVPEAIPFHSAHFKLELFESFGRGTFGDHIGLVDIDTVLLRPFEASILQAPGLVGYEITTTELADYGAMTISATLDKLASRVVSPKWWGGEFLLGRAESFAVLSRYVAKIWPRYLECWSDLHHQGDEALTSAAIALMELDGLMVTDAGAIGGVHRWWSARTRSRHPPLATALEKCLLHLPADKEFLSSFANGTSYDPRGFLAAYRRSARRKAISRRIVDLLRLIHPSGPRKYAPRIG